MATLPHGYLSCQVGNPGPKDLASKTEELEVRSQNSVGKEHRVKDIEFCLCPMQSEVAWSAKFSGRKYLRVEYLTEPFLS